MKTVAKSACKFQFYVTLQAKELLGNVEYQIFSAPVSMQVEKNCLVYYEGDLRPDKFDEECYAL